MSTSSSTQDFRLEAARVIFGASHCRSFLFADDASSDTNDEYIALHYFKSVSDELAEEKAYIWFNVGAAGVDPAPVGFDYGIEVAYAADATGAERAAAVLAAMDAEFLANGRPLCMFKVDSSNAALLLVDNAYPSEISAEVNSATPKVTVSILRVGKGGDLGPTKEAIDVSAETTSFEVKSNQTGELILDKILQGSNLSLEAGFLDVSQENKEAVIGLGVGDILESGSDKIVGLGESRLFQNASEIGGRLILHPIRLDLSDTSADFVMWNTLAEFSGINYDGTDTQAMSASFSANLDSGIDKKINLGVFGSKWITNDVLR